MKEYYIRLEDNTPTEEARVRKIFSTLVKELGVEFYTKELVPKYKPGHLILTSLPKDEILFSEGVQL